MKRNTNIGVRAVCVAKGHYDGVAVVLPPRICGCGSATAAPTSGVRCTGWALPSVAILLACLLMGGPAVHRLTAAEPARLPALPSSEALDKTAAWEQPAVETVKAQVMAWLEKGKASPAVRDKAVALWTKLSAQPSGGELLDCLAGSIALADAKAAKLVEFCSKPRKSVALPDQGWLQDKKLPPLESANLRLLYARWLVHATMFDEAGDQLSGLVPADVVAPAELLFYQGVVNYRLLNQEQGMKAINDLLDGAETSPRRYVQVARLMQADLEALKPDTLDHIARRMEDIQRRLELGRAGPKVRKVEDGVIASLDKLIKKLEDEQPDPNSSASPSGGIQSKKSLPDSMPMSGKGPGQVAKRNIGNKSGWGDLPAKEREEAMQTIGRDYPSHYRDVIEQYFRKLATEEENKK